MKRIIAALCVALIACMALAASAETVVRPQSDGIVKDLVAGKTFAARVNGYATFGEAPNARYELSLVLCERERFAASDIENLKPGDELICARGAYTVKAVNVDEYGYYIIDTTDYYDESLSCYKNEDGTYTISNQNDYPFWRDAVSFDIRLDSDLVYSDWSDPEADEPTKRTVDELMKEVTDDRLFDANNTKVTFDENGKLTIFECTYSPFN